MFGPAVAASDGADPGAGEFRRRLRNARAGLAAIFFIGTLGVVGYVRLEGWRAEEALYMVVITLSTVGFREVAELSPAGRWFTMGLILTGVAAFAYTAANFSMLLIEGELRQVLARRRMQRTISALRDHFIVCGYGRVGREVCGNLRAEGLPLVVIEQDAAALEPLVDTEVAQVQGDATDERTLLAAGLERARALLLTLSSEADNVYVTLLAKDLRPDVLVVARSITEQGERRLRAAGADHVVSPERIGASAMSNSALRPTVVRFAEVATTSSSLELQLDEQTLDPGSELVGRTIEECNIRRAFGLIVVGLVTPDGRMVFNPPAEQRLAAGSTLILLGKRQDLRRFAAATGGQAEGQRGR